MSEITQKQFDAALDICENWFKNVVETQQKQGAKNGATQTWVDAKTPSEEEAIPDNVQALSDRLKEFKDQEARFVEGRQKRTKPLKDIVRNIEASYLVNIKIIRNGCAIVERTLSKALKIKRMQQERARRIEAENVAREQARLQKHIQEARDEVEKRSHNNPPENLSEIAEEKAAIQDAEMSVVHLQQKADELMSAPIPQKVEGVRTRSVRTFVVDDITKVPYTYLMVDEAKVREADKRGLKIEGITFKTEQKPY